MGVAAPRRMLQFILLFLPLLDLYQAKICWKECGNDNVLQSVDITGCKRRSSYPSRQDFRCEGTVGPPCFVQRGDTVLLEVDWVNPGVANMTQSTRCLGSAWRPRPVPSLTGVTAASLTQRRETASSNFLS